MTSRTGGGCDAISGAWLVGGSGSGCVSGVVACGGRATTCFLPSP
jgi:hypothetical protein